MSASFGIGMNPALTLNLLDPALLTRGGHHTEWCRSIAASARRRGATVRVWCHRDASPTTVEAMGPGVEVIRHFSVNPYDGMRNLQDGERLAAWYRAALHRFVTELRAVAPADADLVPTLFPVLLHARAITARPGRLGGCIHHDTSLAPSFNAAMWRSALTAAAKQRTDLAIGVTTPELRESYRTALQGLITDVPVLPVCHDGLRSPAPKTALRSIGFFGKQDRRPKGMSGLFETLGKALVARGHEIVLQDSSDSDARPLDFPVTRLGYVDRFAEALRRCDLVVVPYDASVYRSQGSGVAWEAVASGVPVLAPAGTAAGSFVTLHGAGVTFGRSTAEDICRAVDEASARYREIAEAAHRASLGWLEAEGVDRFVDVLTAGVRPAAAKPLTANPAGAAVPGEPAPAPARPAATVTSKPPSTRPGPASSTTARMKVAVITPCHKEPDAFVRRCIDSVRAQTHPCTHILVGDGVRRDVEQRDDLLHLSLPRGVADFGDTPRGVASIYAAGLGFDAVAYLDVDNWFHPGHVESLVTLAQSSGAAVVTSRRGFHHVDDGRVLAECLMSDGERFCDTNCLFLTRAAFSILPVWALMDRRMHAIDDRVIWYHVLRSGLPRAHTGRPTVAYLATHAPIYQDLGLPVPDSAKAPTEVRKALAAWAAAGLPSLKLRASYRRMRVNPEAGGPPPEQAPEQAPEHAPEQARGQAR